MTWREWSLDPLVVAGLLAAAAAWRWITLRFPQRPWRAAYGWAALVLLAAALLSPLDAGAGRSFTLHMVQHLVLMMGVAPLLALGTPASFLGWLRRRRLLGAVVTWLWSPVPAFALYHITLFFWHLPWAYEGAVRHEGVHLLQHATFLAGSLAFWGVVAAPEPRVVRAGVGHRLVMVLAANVLGWLLAFALALAERPLYSVYAAGGPWGLDPLTDLRLGGGVMWVAGNILYGLTLLLLLRDFFRREERRSGRGAAQENPTPPGNFPATK